MRRSIHAFLGLVLAAFLGTAAPALATPVFDVVVSQINGSPVAPTHSVTAAASDVIRVELRLTIEPGDVVQSAAMPMRFSNSTLVLVGPGSGPATFHVPCGSTGASCALFPGASANSGAATPDSQSSGIVGSMGATSFGGPLAEGTHSLGVVDFHVLGGPIWVEPFIQFEETDGTFRDFGTTPVPFVIGRSIVVPEPSVAVLVGLGLLGLTGVRKAA